MLTLNSRVMGVDSVPGLTSWVDRRLVLFLKTKKMDFTLMLAVIIRFIETIRIYFTSKIGMELI